MSDRTYIRAYIYWCPVKQRPRVLRLLGEYGLHPEYADVDDSELLLGSDMPYMAQEVPVGTAEELADQLREIAPRARWVMWEDPAYQWLGGLYAYAPHLGLFTADCDAGGEVMRSYEEVTRAVSEAVAGLNDWQGERIARRTVQAIGALFGRAWFADWEAGGQGRKRQTRRDGAA